MTLEIDQPLKITDVVMEWCGKCDEYTPHLLLHGLAGRCLHCPDATRPAPAPPKSKPDQLSLF